MRRVLLHLDSDRAPSVFDRIVALDGGAEEVLSYGGVTEADVEGLVHGAIFTRGPKDLANTAIFIGGSDVGAATALLARVKKTFFGPFRVSVMLDPNGSNTTAAAAVVKLARGVGQLKGLRASVLAGTGAVGSRAAGLLARLGADVRITSRSSAHGASVADALGARFGARISYLTLEGPGALQEVVATSDLVLSAGPAGVRLLARSDWATHGSLRAVADVNAVPPAGVEGVEAPDDGVQRDGVLAFGALGIGGLKMKAHKASIARLFERNDIVLDAEEIHDLAAAL
jgi:hypothetical protein